MRKFLNLATPMPSESLYSLLFRTVKANYFTHPATILKEIGPTLYINSCNYMDETKAWYPEYIKNGTKTRI
ncbi:hypothetical protein ACT7DL_07365 [Bacillus paranthracis]